ncbi:MAG: hypothetical protein Phog2KO_06890 [Phototrophicaceae bacterium]
MKFRVLSALLIALLVLVGCRQTNEPTAENVTIGVTLDSDMAMVGDATLLVTVTDEDGNPINDASVSVQGDMTHAGMIPVIPDAVSTAEEGVYAIPFEFTMGGDWIITVDVTLANGEVASTTYEIDGVEGDSDMDDMDMDDMDMDDMDMGSGVSGAYMSITNNSADDVTLVAVSAEGVGMVEIHETTVDENDMASMSELEEGILVPAGATVDLMPGGMHVMLMGLENALVDGETVALTLEFDNDTSIVLDAPIVGMMPEASEAVETDDISVSGYWVRPTALDDMSGMDMDMEMTEEAGMDMEMTEEADSDMDMDTEATEESE